VKTEWFNYDLHYLDNTKITMSLKYWRVKWYSISKQLFNFKAI